MNSTEPDEPGSCRSAAVRRVLRIASATLIGGVIAAGALSAVPSASAAPCPDVELVFARGTREDPGIGRVGQALVDALTPALGSRSLGVYAVDYPASYDFLAAADGATDATNHLRTMVAQCPSTRVVLGGYSQGAAVVDMLAAIPPLGNRVGSVGSAPPLPPDLNGNVAAMAVFGNPAMKFGNPLTTSAAFGSRAIDLCSDGDPVCSDGRNPFAHKNYETSDMPAQAASFVAGLV